MKNYHVLFGNFIWKLISASKTTMTFFQTLKYLSNLFITSEYFFLFSSKTPIEYKTSSTCFSDTIQQCVYLQMSFTKYGGHWSNLHFYFVSVIQILKFKGFGGYSRVLAMLLSPCSVIHIDNNYTTYLQQ